MKTLVTVLLIFVVQLNSKATTFNIGFGGAFGMNYSPSVVNVLLGDTVVWAGDFSVHPLASTTVPSGAATFANSSGSTFSYVVTVAGDYFFHCTIHNFSGQIKASAPSDINNSIVQNNISIYPTSVHNFIKISLPSGSKTLFAEVKNILGQTALKSELSNGSITTLDLSNLYNGIYFVAIRDDVEVVKVVRVVKE